MESVKIKKFGRDSIRRQPHLKNKSLSIYFNCAILLNMEKETSNNEILEAINEFSTKVDEKFAKIEAVMVTKDYLDEKMADLRGDLVVLMRKEDTKVGKLVEVLKRRKVITEAEEKEILSMEPFAKMYV